MVIRIKVFQMGRGGGESWISGKGAYSSVILRHVSQSSILHLVDGVAACRTSKAVCNARCALVHWLMGIFQFSEERR